MAKHSVFVEAKAQKQFSRLPQKVQERMLDVLKRLEEDGLSARMDLKKLRGYQRHYRKVGQLQDKI